MKNWGKFILSACFSLVAIETVFAIQPEKTERDRLIKDAGTTSGIEKILILDKISRTYWNSHPDSSLYYSSLALDEAFKDKGTKCLGEAYQSLGSAYLSSGNNEKAIENFKRSIEYRSDDTMEIKVGHTYSNMGLAYKRCRNYDEANRNVQKAAEIGHSTGDFRFEGEMYVILSRNHVDKREYDIALTYAVKALESFKLVNYKSGIADVDSLIGQIQMSMNNFKAAEKYCRDAYEILAANNDKVKLEKICVLMGILYDKMKYYPKSLEFHKQSIELAKELKNSFSLAANYNNLGCIFQKTGMKDKAIEAFKKSHDLLAAGNINRQELYLVTCNNLAKVYLDKGDTDSAAMYANIVFKNVSQLSDPVFIRELYQVMSAVSRRKGDFKQALKFKALEMNYNDTIYNKEKNRTTIEMLTRFETEKKEQEIALLKKDQEIKQLKLNRQNAFVFVLGILVILLVGIIVMIIIGYRLIQEKNRLLAQGNKELNDANAMLVRSETELKEINATKDKLFSIVAHDLKNPFNALLGLCGLLESSYSDLREEERQTYIRMIHESSQQLYMLLDNLLQWSHSQLTSFTLSPENINLGDIIKQETELLKKNSEEKGIKVKTDADEHLFVHADRNTTSSVLRNLLSNAIKFTSQGGMVEVRAWRKTDENDMIEIAVVDNGIGISDAEMENLFRLEGAVSKKGTSNESGTGLGLVLCREFVEKSNGRIWVISRPGCGSEFHFILPAASL